jgi:hypothetical protein
MVIAMAAELKNLLTMASVLTDISDSSQNSAQRAWPGAQTEQAVRQQDRATTPEGFYSPR